MANHTTAGGMSWHLQLPPPERSAKHQHDLIRLSRSIFCKVHFCKVEKFLFLNSLEDAGKTHTNTRTQTWKQTFIDPHVKGNKPCIADHKIRTLSFKMSSSCLCQCVKQNSAHSTSLQCCTKCVSEANRTQTPTQHGRGTDWQPFCLWCVYIFLSLIWNQLLKEILIMLLLLQWFD